MASSASSVSSERLDANIPGAFPHSNASQTQISTTHQNLTQALYARRAEYTRPRQVRIKVGSWNTAGLKGVEQDIGAWFVDGKGIEESLAGLGVRESDASAKESISAQEARQTSLAPTVPKNDTAAVASNEEVGLYVLGLQEVVDISSATEALRPYTDPSVANKWKASVATALPNGYQLVAEQQLIGLLLLIYASPEVHPHVKSVSTTSVGTGLMGYMGNKGAVTARIVLGETTRLVFVNSHLAAGADKTSLERRNWDAGQITSRTRFDPITDAMDLNQGQGEGIGDEDFAFWFGDLNYRLEGIPGDDVRRLLTVHTLAHDHEDAKDNTSISGDSGYASKRDSEDAVPVPPELDPASLHTTINSLLPHDELRQQQKAGKAFHDGWEEGPIRFLPTYKYDVGKVGVFDSSEKRRGPSWCDRILYRTRASRNQYNLKAKEREEAQKKDEEMKAQGLDQDDDVLYDYDPDTDGDKNDSYDEYDESQDPEPEIVPTKAGFSDEFLLESYTSHLRVISSDHKPLEAVFSLKYDAVMPELKTAIHQEVARELDRQENEGRPSVALVVDHSTHTFEDKDTADSNFDGVDFGDVSYGKSRRRNITIANTGRVPATFGFAMRPVDQNQPEGAFPPWLKVRFEREPDTASKSASDEMDAQYTLQPADVCNAELKLKVDSPDMVRLLNEGTSSLDDVLVLRVENGRDHFLPLRAHWQPSSLTRAVDKLIKIPEGGIRKLQGQKPDGEVRWSVPREIFRLTDSLEDMTERALAEWDMTGHEGNKENAPWQHNAAWPFVSQVKDSEDDEVMGGIIESLDCDESFDLAFPGGMPPREKTEYVAEALLLFLRTLQDGVITKSLWEKLEEGIATREKSKQQLDRDDEKMWVLEILATAPNHNATFLLLISMLQNITHQIAEAGKAKPSTPRASTELPASPRAPVRRRTLSKVPNIALRQLIQRNYATVFADVVFRGVSAEKMREKEKAVRKEKMARVVELFLKNEDDGTG
ncbi:DNase I-like protein [Paraphaeosphaeria sporulosa]|uniref:DNase I-like protein n=1 Tax=Paraphaeosphaeria sporulosa TaxID=1460663 RepID=A0A177CFT4_9PLEO|nr:DNase I-like protein [Paraphaeosphaeria sporulosa]OAG05587.1 DNase I-like protein [Paraphaeosphaeria sporulosa]